MVECSQTSALSTAKMPRPMDTFFTQRRRPYRSSSKEVSYREEESGNSKREFSYNKREEGAGRTRKEEDLDKGSRRRKHISDDKEEGGKEVAEGDRRNQKGQKVNWVFTEGGWSSISRVQEKRVRSREGKEEEQEVGRETEEDDIKEEEGEAENVDRDEDKKESHEMAED